MFFTFFTFFFKIQKVVTRFCRVSYVFSNYDTKDARSVMIATLFLSVLTTMHCLSLTVVTSSNISTSRPTTPFDVYLQLTRYINFLFTYLHLMIYFTHDVRNSITSL